MDSIKLLVTLNEHYLPQLQVMLTSINHTNPREIFSIYLVHKSLSESDLAPLRRQCELFGYTLHPITVDASLFADAPLTRNYPQEMYYRLLAGQILPPELDRILYLDPDTLVLNPLRPLWETDLSGNLFAAAAHTGKTELANSVNQIRLGTQHNYYNSGVLLIDLAAARTEIKPQEIFSYTEAHAKELLFPDQDLLNILYGTRILELDDAIWNYDARNYNNYFLRSSGVCTVDWVMNHTAVLHFCGKAKPWKEGYFHRFGVLYKHYAHLTDLLLNE